MTGSEHILAVIPARGGSRGIPGKNIRPFCGKPLITHTIEAARTSPSVTRVIVSTGNEEIATIAKESGAEVPFLRPAELETDESNIVDAIAHLLGRLKTDENYEPSLFVLLQPTSPLRTSDDIENALTLFRKRDADSLVSVCRTENLLFTKDADDVLSIQNPDQLYSPNRQALSTFYKLDGSMIYMVKTKMFLRERSFFAGRLIGYEIPRWRAVDIDEPQDFVLGELLFENRETIQKKINEFT